MKSKSEAKIKLSKSLFFGVNFNTFPQFLYLEWTTLGLYSIWQKYNEKLAGFIQTTTKFVQGFQSLKKMMNDFMPIYHTPKVL